MDLDEVRRKLTAGYERINKMKNSITKVETCRAKLKVKQERILEEVKAMMNQTTAQLFQLQQYIEVTVKATVTERERQLDAKKKEIHDGYAKLVQVCVEADKVLRGRNDDLLGRSCQRLFNSFDKARFKLDAAERIDVEGITAFEFQNNMKQFLSSTFVAKLQHFDRYHKVVEVDEFRVDTTECQTSPSELQMDRKESDLLVSNHVDSFNNNRSAASWQSPGSHEPPRPPLATIQEVPEDNSSFREQRIGLLKRRLASSIDVVHIREVDLCLDREIVKDCANKMKAAKSDSSVIPPPPGFLPLQTCDLPSRYAHADVNMQLPIKRSINPLSSPDISSDSSLSGRISGESADCWSAGCCCDDFSGVSNPDTSPASSEPNAASSYASSMSARSCSSPAESSKSIPKATKSAERPRDEEDFIWESDDSADVPSSEQGSEKTSLTDSSGTSEHTAQSELSSVPPQTAQDMKTSHSSKPAALPCVKVESSKLVLGSAKLAQDPHSPQKPSAGDAGRSASGSTSVKGASHCLHLLDPGTKSSSGALSGGLGPPGSKNIALKTFEYQSISRCSVPDRGDHPHCPNTTSCPTAADVNIVSGQTSDKRQHPDREESGRSITEKCWPVEAQEEKAKQATLNLNEEAANLHVKQEDSKPQMRKEMGFVSVKAEPVETELGETAISKPVDTGPEEAAVPKVVEVPRPLKTRSKRLDLSHMLEHVGGGLFEISAKCVEKIRGDFDHPIGVCTNSKGDVIVADTSNNIIKVYNNGRVTNKFGTDLKMRRPSAVVVNEKDEIFVKDDHCLYHFDSEGQFIKTMGKKMMNAPYGLAMTKGGQLVVVDALYSNARIHIFQQSGAIDTYPYQPLRNRYDDSKCRFLAVHGEDLLTSDLGRSCLYLTSLRGELLKTLGRRGKRPGEMNEPAGVAVDSMGNWVVADSRNHRVQVFAQNGYFMASVQFSGESVRRPSGIHLTSDGLLYVINYWDSVIKVFKLGTF